MKNLPFDYTLADECARSYCEATGLGCTVSDNNGKILSEHGYGCASCKLCEAANLSKGYCIRTHNYFMTKAERFGGRYIYFCPLGLTCFVSPIIGEGDTSAKITVGPLLMVELQDFIDCELTENFRLTTRQKQRILNLLQQVPQLEPHRVQALSVLLFMSVGYINDLSSEKRLSEQEQDMLSKHYPFETEEKLLQAISEHNTKEIRRTLHSFLSSLFAMNNDVQWVKEKAKELVVLISRTSMEHGATEKQALSFLADCRHKIPLQKDLNQLNKWLSSAIIHFVDHIEAYPDAKHANIINRCVQYIHSQYAEHLTLQDVASFVSLSADHFSRIFKKETGHSFKQYLNNVRITKAKELIRHTDLTLTDISQLVGYDDQSYFTKVFKRTAGLSPNEYRKHGGLPIKKS